MPIADDAAAWIRENGMGAALQAARADNPPEVNLERFAAQHPDTDYNVLSAVFATALSAVAAGLAVRGIGTQASPAKQTIPRSSDVEPGMFRYRFTVRFTPRADQPGLRIQWRSSVEDFSHELSLSELDAIQQDLELRFAADYGFDERYETPDFIIESILRG